MNSRTTVALVPDPTQDIPTFIPVPAEVMGYKCPREHCADCGEKIPPGKPGRSCKPCRKIRDEIASLPLGYAEHDAGPVVVLPVREEPQD